MRKRTWMGICKAQVTGVRMEALLCAIASSGVSLWDVQVLTPYTVECCFYAGQLSVVETLAKKYMCDVVWELTSGGRKWLVFLRRHIALFLSLAVLFFLLCLSSFFVWDIRVYGNSELSTGEVLRCLAECGVDYGCYWPEVDRELLRNKMILELPELAWMSVNFHASRANVLLLEREEKSEIYQESGGGDLIAVRAGIIKEINAFEGKEKVSPGDAVQEGDVLVSGIMDSMTQAPRLVRAQGRVLAETWYEERIVAPEIQSIKKDITKERVRFAVKIGSQRVNFYFPDRKTVDGLEKNIDNYIVGIKGVFALPLTLIVERFCLYETCDAFVDDRTAMAKRAEDTLRNRIDGELLRLSSVDGVQDGLHYVAIRAACRENIAHFDPYVKLQETIA